MKTSKFKEFDYQLKRIIVRDFSDDSLFIIGDYSASSLSTFWVVDKSNPDIPYNIYITRESALRRKDYCNRKFHTDKFVIIERTIFV